MKKAIRFIATIIAVVIVVVGLNILTDGVPLLGTPDAENVSSVIVEHSNYPDETKEHTDKTKIELAVAMLGYLNYSPLKGLSDDVPVIKVTYVMNDNTEIVVKANDKTVWWNGKAYAITDENTFVKMCTAVFYLQKN
ncbi:MAG: hypothetical protein E7523_12930 [Ruminococcaceae bacterium]|nr:hypothetical protein [Oscillospiraceae bacterium]